MKKTVMREIAGRLSALRSARDVWFGRVIEVGTCTCGQPIMERASHDSDQIWQAKNTAWVSSHIGCAVPKAAEGSYADALGGPIQIGDRVRDVEPEKYTGSRVGTVEAFCVDQETKGVDTVYVDVWWDVKSDAEYPTGRFMNARPIGCLIRVEERPDTSRLLEAKAEWRSDMDTIAEKIGLPKGADYGDILDGIDEVKEGIAPLAPVRAENLKKLMDGQFNAGLNVAASITYDVLHPVGLRAEKREIFDKIQAERLPPDSDLPSIAQMVALKKSEGEQMSILYGQIDALQTEMSAMVDSSLSRTVRAFQLRFGHKVRWKPEIPKRVELVFRLRLITEEFLELLTAAGVEVPASTWLQLQHIVLNKTEEVNFAELVDAMGDLEYVIEGTRAVCGVNGKPIAAEIHRANMQKEPVLGADGKPDPLSKPTKPDDWTPPDIAGCLRKQGYST